MTMFLVFDQLVDVSRSQLVINTFSLLNRLGGYIGFCKEILWITLLIAGLDTFFKSMLNYIINFGK